ncbi:GNAT family N-acetyltransferase [Thalassiella azotivora]
MAVVVRAEQPGDRTAVAGVVDLAFASGEEGAEAETLLVEALRADGDAWLPRLGLVALDGGEVVGYALGSRMHVGGSPAVALAPVAVHPEHQRRGVGQALVRRLLGEARSAGETLVVVLGDPGYYGRFGFGPAEDLGIVGPYGGPAFQALQLAADAPVGLAAYPVAFQSV